MPLEIVRNDITAMKVDVIVNSAHPTPEVGGGVDYAIHRAAGPELIAERRKIGDIATGTAFITPAFQLPAKYVVHTVGPIWQDGKPGQRKQLADCYTKSMELALENKCTSIAFPLISAGVFGCPAEIAIATAVQAVKEFLAEHEMQVYLVVFDRKAFKISSTLFDDVQDYLDKNYLEELFDEEIRIEEQRRRRSALELPALGDEPPECGGAGMMESLPVEAAPAPKRAAKRQPAAKGKSAPDLLQAKSVASKKPRALSDLVEETDDTFSEALLRLIDAKGKKDPEIYKRANVDRKHFAKIRKNPNYQPSKATALALAIALELNLDETKDFIGRAGYAISHSNKTDIIVEYFIERKDYDIFTINETLFAFGQACLG